MDKPYIAKVLCNSQDMGEKLSHDFLRATIFGTDLLDRWEGDFLSRFILEGLRSANDFEDIQRHLAYGIDQLQRAAIALKKIEPQEA
jgi:hypothetical protein